MVDKSRKSVLWKIILISIFILIGLIIFGINQFNEAKKIKSNCQKEIEYYQEIGRNEQQWIVSIQLSNGVLPFRGISGNRAEIIPYFSNSAAMELLSGVADETYQNEVKEYMDWYLSHINTAEEDLYGVDGTIYDYSVVTENGIVITETSKGSYDSVDSYSATFIMLLWEYYEITGDKDYLLKNEVDILRVLNALVSTIDEDGLSVVKDGYPIKYLMDNSEVNMGLKNAILLLDRVYLDDRNYNDSSDEMVLKNKLEVLFAKNTESIEQRLWNKNENRYEVGLNNNNKVITFNGWNHFYPDAVAQIFPGVFDVDSQDNKRFKSLYERFCENYDWENLEHYKSGEASFYWPILAYVGSLMEDEDRVKSYLKNYETEIVEGHPYPIYIADAGWIVRTCEEMINYYENKMNRVDPFNLIQ